jgi:hypothetical protein
MHFCESSKAVVDAVEELMVAEEPERRNDAVSAEDNLAVLHIAASLVSEWVAWRSWFQNGETVADPPLYQPRKVVQE